MPLASTWSHPRFVLVGPVLLISLDFCVVFFRLFVVVQCLVCPVLPMFLDCSFLITLRFPLMFSYMFTLKSFLVDILLHKMLSTEWALHWSCLLGAFKIFAFLSWKNMQWCVLCIEKYLVNYFTFNCSDGVVFYSNCKMLWNCSSWHWYLYT